MIPNKRNPVVFMFSGQGSQYYQMGRELFEGNDVFRYWMLTLDNLVRPMVGASIVEQLYGRNGVADSFDCLLYTHPAIFMVEYSMAQTLIETGVQPDCVLGVSMGEYAAAVVSGVISIEACLNALIRQVEILGSSCVQGGMLAVLHKPGLFDETPLFFENAELAAVNYAEHFVISGSIQRLEKITGYLKEKNLVFQRLPVSFAFHSSLIEPGGLDYTKHLRSISLSPPKVPFVSCATASTHTTVCDEHFWQVIRRPILFEQTIRTISSSNESIYLDLGPSGTLSTFIKYISLANIPQSHAIMSPFSGDMERLEKVLRLARR